MRGGRILWGPIAVVFAIVVVTTWAATQWTAWRLGFHLIVGDEIAKGAALARHKETLRPFAA